MGGHGRWWRAAACGVAAAGAYLAGSSRPGKGLAVAGLLACAATTTVKAYTTEQRLNNLLAHGGTFGGDVHVTGRVFADGGITMGGNLFMQSNNINNLAELNTDGGTWGFHGPAFANGQNLHMQGGTVIP
jgi:hypothetical protein